MQGAYKCFLKKYAIGIKHTHIPVNNFKAHQFQNKMWGGGDDLLCKAAVRANEVFKKLKIWKCIPQLFGVAFLSLKIDKMQIFMLSWIPLNLIAERSDLEVLSCEDFVFFPPGQSVIEVVRSGCLSWWPVPTSSPSFHPFSQGGRTEIVWRMMSLPVITDGML